MFFTYAYLLRVPVVAGLVLGALAPFALWKGSQATTLDTAVFQYPDPDTPLSWHLTAAEKDAVWNAYARCTDRGVSCERRVRDFVQGQTSVEGCRQFDEPPRPAPTRARPQAK